MSIHRPEWLLWVLGLGLGIPLLAALLFLAWFGFMALRALSDWRMK